jgi:hypothetical protein
LKDWEQTIKLFGDYNFAGRDANFYGGDTACSFVLSAMRVAIKKMKRGTAPDAAYLFCYRRC